MRKGVLKSKKKGLIETHTKLRARLRETSWPGVRWEAI